MLNLWHRLASCLCAEPADLLRYVVPCQVYVATWQHTPVAVKILLNTALDVYSEEAVKQALILSNPVLKNLQKV